MAQKKDNLTGAGKAIMYSCVAIAIVASIVTMNLMEMSGAIPGALFGGVGGLVGGAIGFGLASVTGNVIKD